MSRGSFKFVAMGWIGTFLAAASALGSVSGRTEARYYSGDRLVLGPQKLTGSSSPGIVPGAFMLGRKAHADIATVLAPYFAPFTNEQLAAFGFALPGFPAASSITSRDIHFFSVDPLGAYDSVVIEFRAWSETLKLTDTRTAAPTVEGISFDAPEYAPGDRGVRVAVRLQPKVLGGGTYPVLFRTQEGTGESAIATIHLVLVRMESACRRNPARAACRPKFLDQSRVELKTAAAYERIHQIIAEDGGIAELLSGWRALLSSCGDNNAQCMERAAGPCPDLAVGASNRTCVRLREVDAELESAIATRNELQAYFNSTDCCLFE